MLVMDSRYSPIRGMEPRFDPASRSPEHDWTITLPGLPGMVGVARAYCWATFADTPCGDAAELIVSELATNSLRHTPSGATDGRFSVRAMRAESWGRVEVADAGTGRWRARKTHPDEIEDYGRGLSIVARLATRVGHSVTAEGQAMWAEISWNPPSQHPPARNSLITPFSGRVRRR